MSNKNKLKAGLGIEPVSTQPASLGHSQEVNQIGEIFHHLFQHTTPKEVLQMLHLAFGSLYIHEKTEWVVNKATAIYPMLVDTLHEVRTMQECNAQDSERVMIDISTRKEDYVNE